MCVRRVLLSQKVKESNREQRLVDPECSMDNESSDTLIKRESQP